MAVTTLGMTLVAIAVLASAVLNVPANDSSSRSTILDFASWIYATLDSAGDVGDDNSIAADSYNTVHISYYDGTNGDLRYATNAGGSWICRTLDSAGDVGIDTSIAVDSNNKVHISYLDGTNVDLKYATNAGGSWAYYTVDSIGDVGLFTSIAVDSNNKVHISYLDLTNYDLRYATNASGAWVCYTLDSVGDVGFDTSIAVDSNDKVHISYGDWTNGDLKYATNAGGSWTCYTLDSLGAVGFDTSIAVDSSNKVHISYHDETNACLKYVTNVAGSWAAYTLDSAGNVGLSTSIAVDTKDKVHIGYCDYTDFANGHVKYATNEGGSWVDYTLDSSGDVGFDTALAVDSRNIVHISYSDYMNNDLRYAFGTSRNVPELAVSISASSVAGQRPLTVLFMSRVIGGLEPYTYSWTFGDGGTDSTQDPVHTYAENGTYRATLVVTDSMSTSKSVQKTLTVSYGSVVLGPGDDSGATTLAIAAGAVIALAVISVVALLLMRKRTAPTERRFQALDIKEQAVLIELPVERRAHDSPQVGPSGHRWHAPVLVKPRLSRIEDKLFQLRSMKEKGLIGEKEYDERIEELLKRW